MATLDTYESERHHIRPKGFDWTAPVPGDTSATAWKGIHPVDDLVHVFNPPQGFMQNCNVSPENMMPDSPFSEERYLTDIFNVGDWEVNNPRGIRTRQLLDNDDSVTREEAIAIVLDVHDIQAERWQKELRAAVDAEGGRFYEVAGIRSRCGSDSRLGR